MQYLKPSLTSTLIIILMVSSVCYMIKKTRRPHNFLITNMIIADMILTLWSTIPAGIAIIMGYVAGRDVIHFGLLNFTLH